MIDFMVIGLPRSGTTWAANWLCTERTHCVHDPLYRLHYSEWDKSVLPGKQVGVSCTGIWQWPEWLNAHPAKKVILHRDLAEVNASLDAIGFPACDDSGPAKLAKINGLHLPHEALFDASLAAVIHSHLIGDGSFDAERHAELCLIEMQPNFHGLTVGKEVTRRLLDEVMQMVKGEC